MTLMSETVRVAIVSGAKKRRVTYETGQFIDYRRQGNKET